MWGHTRLPIFQECCHLCTIVRGNSHELRAQGDGSSLLVIHSGVWHLNPGLSDSNICPSCLCHCPKPTVSTKPKFWEEENTYLLNSSQQVLSESLHFHGGNRSPGWGSDSRRVTQLGGRIRVRAQLSSAQSTAPCCPSSGSPPGWGSHCPSLRMAWISTGCHYFSTKS